MATRMMREARPRTQHPSPALPAPANPLVDVGKPLQTLSNARAVLAFVRDWNTRVSPHEHQTDDETYGLSLVLSAVDEAVAAAGAELQGVRS